MANPWLTIWCPPQLGFWNPRSDLSGLSGKPGSLVFERQNEIPSWPANNVSWKLVLGRLIKIFGSSVMFLGIVSHFVLNIKSLGNFILHWQLKQNKIYYLHFVVSVFMENFELDGLHSWVNSFDTCWFTFHTAQGMWARIHTKHSWYCLLWILQGLVLNNKEMMKGKIMVKSPGNVNCITIMMWAGISKF